MSNDEITLKTLVSLHNDNLSRENRFLLVEIGKSIEALITVHQMCEFGCHDQEWRCKWKKKNHIKKECVKQQIINLML